MQQDWNKKKVGVLGAGVEGFATAAYLANKGASVTLLDHQVEDDLDQTMVSHAKKLGITFITGKEYLARLTDFAVVVRSPGVKRSKALLDAAEKGVVLTSQTQIFLESCPCPIIGVTGTKGKGTTSSLIYEMLKKSGFDVYLGGNIGTPPLTFLDSLTNNSRVVLELSSFQLQDVTKSPHIAVLLMITSEHLDYHDSHEEYIAAKRNILRFQEVNDFAVINRDYPASHESDIYTEGQVFQVSRERPSTKQGCFIKDDAVWIAMQGKSWKIINTSDIALPGKHNWENVCAAVMAATLAGAAKEDIVAVLRSFTGLEHRLQLVRDVGGVRYYDDSFSTTPETAIAAINAFQEPEILILGGSSKKADFSELGEIIRKAKNIKAIIGIGEEWPRIKQEIHNLTASTILIEGAKNMEQIVKAAATIALPGDVVLLSPACASFDMFKNYKDRGEQFQKVVKAL
jgi:UDP-N-acetylmuramoylalanine--D-glutamate ligase